MVPIISLSGLQSQDPKELEDLREAARSVGFFYLYAPRLFAGHDPIGLAKQFFNDPNRNDLHINGSRYFRGYSEVNISIYLSI